ncbi:FG-GAP repeat protein [candidate division WOR-3 bacterium]|nr:FG-GAP repeat protein [candidate division WOR-3 bacterium]
MIRLLNSKVRIYPLRIRIFFISFIVLTPSLVYPLELHNLELVLEIMRPDTSSIHSPLGIGLASGDVNGDGFSDIIVGGGGIGYDKCVCVYYGGETPDPTPDVIIMQKPEDEGNAFGNYVTVGDINGDGYDDVMIGGGYQSRAYFGGDPMDSLPDLMLECGEWMGCGDLNNDGYDDWAIGQCVWDEGRGKVIIYFGDSIPDIIPDIVLYGEEIGRGNFGGSIQSGFDVNGDGYEDLFISAKGYYGNNGTWQYQGKTYIYYGGDPMDTVPDVTMLGKCPWDFFGIPALVPDLTGDGFDDACVGDPLDNVHDTVYSYWGGNPMDSGVDLIFSGEYSRNRFGNSIGGIEKVHPSGSKAVSIGSCCYPDPYIDTLLRGKVYVYLGGTSLDIVVDAWAVGVDSQEIGWVVASAGDVDGDGIDEIMFSNYAALSYIPHKVWICKYTGPGVEETNYQLAINNYQLAISPNPVVRRAVINYQLPVKSKVSLEIYDVSGRLVKKLFDKSQKLGQYEVIWNGTDEKGKSVASGVYVFKLKVKSEKLEVERTKKILFLKE